MFVGMLGIILYGFQNTDQGLDEEDRQRAKEAIQKAALECYSIEGAYPESLDYMVNVMTHVKNKTNNDILKIKC